jgi:tRNA 2-thiocytidine biosynthesis protein TtcA
MGKALHHYQMISDGDRIVVGVSGGADSLSLMWLLSERRKRIPIHYDLFAVFIDPGFEGSFAEPLKAFCAKLGFTLRVEYTDFGIQGHSTGNRENPCFLCSRLRRKRLFEIAHELGCYKLALGHNRDDVIETLFMNICFAGEISTMLPSQSFFHKNFTLIRPLAFADEALIRQFTRHQRFPGFENPCPAAKTSKRQEIKALLAQLYRSNKKIKGNIFRAMSHVRLDYLLKP